VVNVIYYIFGGTNEEHKEERKEEINEDKKV
jgi:hypothetical protein